MTQTVSKRSWSRIRGLAMEIESMSFQSEYVSVVGESVRA
jgi:hypothetical protein